ncbi:MAG: HAD-IA family hydrolase [Pseudomonas sp.]
MAELRTLIFDWDGTLSNSISRIVESMRAAADAVGIQLPAEQAVRDIIGLGLPEAVAVLFPDIDDPGLAQRLSEAYSEHFIATEQTPSPLFDGVLEDLERFRKAGLRLAVATGKSRRGLDRVLQSHDLTNYFDITRCADESLSKPHPKMLEEILNRLETPAASAVMLGDSEYDIRMAHNARVRAVAVSYGAQSREHLLQSRPEHCIDAFSEFRDWVMSPDNTKPSFSEVS